MPATASYVTAICRIDQGAATCRYLIVGTERYECGKLNVAIKAMLDQRVRDGKRIAQGDHCPGRTADLLNPPV